MPQIHTTKTPSSSYTPPPYISQSSTISWLPYTEGSKNLETLRATIEIIETRIKNHSPCNQAFKRLPFGKTFAQIWSDPNVWINMDPSNDGKLYGAALGNHITLSKYTLNMGRWNAAATLVHELAHVGGAGGSDTMAEDVLLKCLLKNLHNPNIIGNLIRDQKFKRNKYA